MVLCLLFIFLAVNFDWSIILNRKSFGASRHISGKLGVKLAIVMKKKRISHMQNKTAEHQRGEQAVHFEAFSPSWDVFLG